MEQGLTALLFFCAKKVRPVRAGCERMDETITQSSQAPIIRLVAVALSAILFGFGSASAETPDEWVALGTRVHGGFGAFIPLGIKIGEDAVERHLCLSRAAYADDIGGKGARRDDRGGSDPATQRRRWIQILDFRPRRSRCSD